MAHNSDQNSSGRRGEKDALTGGGYPAGQKPTKGVPPVPAGLTKPRTTPPLGKRPT
jgi:hypothetical protein